MRNVSRRILAALLTALVCVTVVTPAHARFVSVDPVKPDTHTGEDFNHYAYARGNPYGYVDPDGRLPIAIPIAMTCAPCATTIQRTPLRCAPSAMRTPISRVRSATTYDSTP